MLRTNVRQQLTDASQELGLPNATLSTQQQDPTGYQMGGLMNSLGEELLRVHD